MSTRDFSPAPIEPLESRIAPAVIIAPGGRSAHYTDVDGDLVTITVSKGKLSPNDFLTMSYGSSVPDGEQLIMINFADDHGEFNHANVTITAKPGRSGGDGHANIGSIDAGDGRTDLGKVSIDGNLGGIMAGDVNTKTPGVKLLIAEAFTGYSGSVAGGIAKIKVAGDQTSGNSGTGNPSSSGGSTVTSGSIIITGSSAGSSSSVVKTGTGTGNLGSVAVLGNGTITSGATLSLYNPTSYLPVTTLGGSNTLTTNTVLNSVVPANLSPSVTTSGAVISTGLISGGTLSLGSSAGVVRTLTPTAYVGSGLTIDAGNLGSSGLVKAGTGTLQLTANNLTYSGVTTLGAGSLVANTTSGVAYFQATNTGSTALQFADLKNVEIKVGDDTVKVASDSTLTFTAEDGSTESAPGGLLSIGRTADGTRASVTLTGLDPATAASNATAFDVMVNDATVRLVQNHALFDKLIANGWTVSSTGTQTGSEAVTIKLTSPGIVSLAIPSRATATA